MKLIQKLFRGYSVLEKIDSKINGKIEIREDIFGRKSLLVGGISQSGHLIEKSWQKPLKLITGHPRPRLRLTEGGQSPITNVLILGLGAGSAAKVIHNSFPKAKITGMEIDPIMIKMAKKYFDLSTVKNLEIKICDAISLITDHCSLVTDPDLILVDLYLGDRVPKEATTERFLKDVKKSLSPSGIALFNRLYYGKKKKEANQFESRLKKIFSEVEPLHVSANIFFLCQ